ncbi:MAG: hypothetical protein GQ553_04440 [Nitrosomonadaceae bacterium]|nr:hypothetical protein [Nitrosomonadaceae bacterium]
MATLYLFGSRATGEYTLDSDWDVFIDAEQDDEEAGDLITTLEPYLLENGGKLDLFELLGDVLFAVGDEHGERRVMLCKWGWRALQQEAEKIDIDTLLKRMESSYV